MDAARLRAGLDTVPTLQRNRIMARAAESVSVLRNLGYPGDPVSGVLDEKTVENILYLPEFLNLPCPALDLESGSCSLYMHRPVACRVYGLAILLDGMQMPHCRLNYSGATPQEIEERRAEIETSAAGDAALDEFLAAGGREGQTVVAFALTES